MLSVTHDIALAAGLPQLLRGVSENSVDRAGLVGSFNRDHI
jgi:hypothetical protein